jgi:hypothetical protein
VGNRFLFHEITLRFNATVFQQMFNFYLEEIERTKHLPGIAPVLVLQPISEISRVSNEKNGGNPFGFSDGDGPIIGVFLPPSLPLASLLFQVSILTNVIMLASVARMPTMGPSRRRRRSQSFRCEICSKDGKLVRERGVDA